MILFREVLLMKGKETVIFQSASVFFFYFSVEEVLNSLDVNCPDDLKKILSVKFLAMQRQSKDLILE